MNTPNILLVTKGHPFDKNAFFEIFDSINVNWTHVEQPAAQKFFDESLANEYDAFVMYDMPGVSFEAEVPSIEKPDPDYQKGFLSLLDKGKGMVFLHHAIAGWPAWEEYAEIIGGRFLYLSEKLRGSDRQDSGYRHKVNHRLTVIEDHPITAGLPESFGMIDELYLCEIFEDSIQPLLRSDYKFTQDNFYSSTRAINGKMYDNAGWQHDEGSNVVAWIKRYGNSPIAYIQGGDDPEAYTNQNYRRLIENSIHWVSSQEAHEWVKDQ